MRIFENLQDLQAAFSGWSPGMLEFEDILVAKGVLWDEEKYPLDKTKKYRRATAMTVVVDNFKSKAQKPWPKGTTWIVPTKS